MLYNCTPSSSSYVTKITKRFYNLNPCNSIALFQASDLPFRLSNHSLINTKSYKVLLLDILSYFLFCRFNPSTMVKTKDLTLSPDVILPRPGNHLWKSLTLTAQFPLTLQFRQAIHCLSSLAEQLSKFTHQQTPFKMYLFLKFWTKTRQINKNPVMVPWTHRLRQLITTTFFTTVFLLRRLLFPYRGGKMRALSTVCKHWLSWFYILEVLPTIQPRTGNQP